MNVIKRIIAILLIWSMVLITATAEGTYNLYFNASFNSKTGEATLTKKEIIKETDFSHLWVDVTKINSDGTESDY